MILAHKIRLNSTLAQEGYFLRACGTARRVWNWALGEWNKQYEAGKKPNALSLKKQFNAIKYQEFPWLRDMHRDSHSQPFSNLGKAWAKFFSDVKAGKPAYPPQFKKKGRCKDSFYVANDKFRVDGKTVVLPKIGAVSMTEELRFSGKILGASVSRTSNKWFISIQVEVPDEQANLPRKFNGVIGVDLGIKAAATCSDGKTFTAPKPLKAALRRLKIRTRRVSRKVEAAKSALGMKVIPKGVKIPASNNRKKSVARLAALHARIANIRSDFLHKMTNQICRENQAIGIETLNVAGMLKNENLARAISDIGFGQFSFQMEYKSVRFDSLLVKADTWYPSSKLCSVCGCKNTELKLSDRFWTCRECGSIHDRDGNASQNLEGLARKGLPVASSASPSVGKVTPARYEHRLQEDSGQEINCALTLAHF